MTDPLRRELLEELARAMCHATRNNRGCTTKGDPCADGCKCPAECLVTTEYADSLLPILTRELAAARKAGFVAGYNAGFMASGEGFNGEYPHALLEECEADKYWLDKRDAAIRALED